MSPLVKIRSERDQMSAVERRIADFVLDNAQLLRDYSSQQLANALGISQSSVVKFTQKLGFKGYPDLKYSVGEAIARADNGDDVETAAQVHGETGESLATGLWRRKSEAEEATRLINPPQTLAAVIKAMAKAGRSGKVFLIGLGEDDIHARGFAYKLALLGLPVVHNFDIARMAANVSAAGPGDVLLVFSEHGNHPALCKIGRHFRERRGMVVSVTRHSANPLRTLADAALLVSAHDERPYIQSLLYQSALQHLLDVLFVQLCEGDDTRHAQLVANLERIQQVLEP
ncbi:MurR/RpiR family transcriptional regulator [Rhodanobacter sp. DHG33]|uniref:MurR/RpiR family transcriptional regulator n=1 Tax=Rhodanobacter sp. DHG33 TaxID=2775921 RepID=UPI001786D834|nr:MurR/RpiR family transcriptional regulator [Rhodanobacter sp. DHG33]MBD8897598.1 MurR/RpiR family transcriptional regulator [Rhodanobacter sp. DHG33]